MSAREAVEAAARLVLEAPAMDPLTVARVRVAAGERPKQRGRTGNASDFNAKHKRVAKGRTGGGQFAAGQTPEGQQAAAARKGEQQRQRYQMGNREKAQHEVDKAIKDANRTGRGSRSSASRSSASLDVKDPLAVKRFQQEHGLKVDGIVGPETRGEMQRQGLDANGQSTSGSGASGGSSSGGGRGTSRARRSGQTKGADWQGQLGAGTLRRGDGMDRKGGDGQVKQLQAKLEAFGYDLGDAGVDGKLGPVTQRAIKRLQSDYGLKVDGIVGNRTKRLLNMLTTLEQRRTKGGLSIDSEKLGTTEATAAAAATAGLVLQEARE